MNRIEIVQDAVIEITHDRVAIRLPAELVLIAADEYRARVAPKAPTPAGPIRE